MIDSAGSTQSEREYNIHSSMAYEEAYRDGKEVKLPEDTELFVDIDSEENYQLFLAQIEKLREFSEAIIVSDTPSSSGLPRRHIVVEMGRYLKPIERIALQTVLGSDPLRELFGIVRVWMNDPTPTLFLEKKA